MRERTSLSKVPEREGEGCALALRTTDRNSRVTVLQEFASWKSDLVTPQQILEAAGLPDTFKFVDDDRNIGWIASEAMYAAISESVPVYCADLFIVRESHNGNLELFTAVRTQWPLDGFRTIVGGRIPRPATEHPLAMHWNRDLGTLLVLFRETGVQPFDVKGIAPLISCDFVFSRVVGQAATGRREIRYTPVDAYVVILRASASQFSPQSIAGLEYPLWISSSALDENTELLNDFGDYMRASLSLLFHRSIPLLTTQEARHTFIQGTRKARMG